MKNYYLGGDKEMEGNEKMKRVYNALGRIGLIVLFAVLLTLIPANKAYAGHTIGDYEYSLDVSTLEAEVIKYIGAGGDISIPATVTYDGKKFDVVGIRYKAFYENKDIISVNIPNSVISIGNNAFDGCTNMTNVTIPDGLTSMGIYVFCGCTALEDIIIPSGIPTIPQSTFENCKSLTHVSIPDNISEIGQGAFAGCTNLTNISIPDSVTTMRNWVFRSCINLTNISIPDSVTTIGAEAFKNCTSLTSISLPKNIPAIYTGTFNGCSNLTDIKIPSGVTTIREDAFTNCTRLTQIYYPTGTLVIDAGLNTTNNITNVISYATNTDDTITLTVENIADGITTLSLPTIYDEKTVSAIKCADGVRKLQLAVPKPSQTMNTTCDDDTVGDLSLPVNWKWQDSNIELTAETPVVANVIYDKLDREIYSDSIIAVTITTQHIGETEIKGNKETSCKEPGYTGDTYCVTCDKKVSEGIEIPKTDNHSYDGGVPTTKATFTDTGVMTYTCTVCTTQTRTEDIPALTAPSATITTTCSNGTVSDLTLPANWQWKNSDADKVLTLDSPVTAVAVYDGVDKANYSTTELTITIITEHIGQTTLKNVKETSCKEAGYTGDIYCVNCDTKINDGNVVAKANTHSYDNGVITKQPSTTENGVKTYTCTVCKATKTEDIAKLSAPSVEEPEEEIPDTDEESSTPVEPDEEKETSEDDVTDVTEDTEDTSNDEEDTTAPVVQPEPTVEDISEDKAEESDLNILFVIIPVAVLAGAGGIGFVFFNKKK